MPLLIWLLSVAGTALNPRGPALLRYLWDELSRPHPITEWQPALPWESEHSAFFAMLAVFCLTLPFFRQWRSRGWEIVLGLGAGFFAIRHQRHTPVFALCAAVPLAAQLDGAVAWLNRRGVVGLSQSAQRILQVGLMVLGVLQLGLTGLRLHRDGMQIVFDPAEYPTAAVRALRAAGAHGNLALPLDWGAYALWHLAPQIKPSIDGRFATIFPVSVVDDNFAFFRGTPSWRRLIDAYPTEAALLPAYSACPIRREPGWQRVYADAVAELYVRADRLGDFEARAVHPTTNDGVFP